MSGDDKHIDTVISSIEDGYVKKEMFVSIVNKIIHFIGCYTDALPAYQAIRLEMNPKNMPQKSVIKYYHKGNQEHVPKEIYIAAKKALRTLTGKGPADKMIDNAEKKEKKGKTPEKKETERADKKVDRKKRRKRGRKKSKDIVLTPKLKDYEVPEGEVPYFALKAVVDAIKQNNGYCSIPSLDEQLHKEGVCKKGALKRGYRSRKNFSGKIYDRLVNLLMESNSMKRLEQEQLEKLRQVQTYDFEKIYCIGQIIRVERGEFGVVIGKEKFDRIVVSMHDGQERMFRENLRHDKSHEKKPIDPFMIE